MSGAAPTVSEIERRLIAYQRLSNVCLHAGKMPGGPWNIRVIGHCPLTFESVRVCAVGSDETWGSALLAVWFSMERILGDSRLTQIC